MENYEQKYKEALEQAKKELKACGSLDCDAARQIFRLFPELKESDGERIRKELLDYLNERIVVETPTDTKVKKAWIEWLKSNPIFDMPKIEFKIGDWVIFKCGTPESVYKVEKLENYKYTLRHILGGSMPLPFGSRNLIRPWTIQDAKDGDVLVCEGKISKDKYGQEVGIVKKYIGRIGGCSNCFETYCFIDWNGNFRVNEAMGSSNIHPATKEQRDILFQKIEKARYKWDVNKKRID